MFYTLIFHGVQCTYVKIFSQSLLFPPFSFTFVVLQSLVGCIGNPGDGDQLGKDKPDQAQGGDHHPSHHQVPPQQEHEEAAHHQTVADEEDEEARLAPCVIHLPILRPKAARRQEILLCLQSQRNSKNQLVILKC